MDTVNKTLDIAIIGYGKMGRAVEKVALSRGHSIGAVVDREDQWEDALPKIGACDVAIEFTNPDAAPANIQKCFEAGTPVVTGTTGWLPELPAIIRHCEESGGTLLHASNFSIGVNVFFAINERLARLLSGMKGYRVRIAETHHTQKLDVPSGTAITLAKDIIAYRPDLNQWGNADDNLPGEALPIKSCRIEDVTGTHLVAYESSIDTIEIKHTALDRIGFAEGALLAAEWVNGKKGVFTMKEMLNI